MERRKTAAGIRFSVVDAIFLLLCAGGTWILRPAMREAVWVIPFAAGHFFLFCNVFRVRRSYELAWVAAFFAIVAAAWVLGWFSWPLVLAGQSPFTLLAIGAELRSARYHGIGWSRINPRLEEATHEAPPVQQ